ncbi:hypothetical protein [Streptomyces sp. NPDC050121]|uniref:hypothetical protein n=1 Tax=Streptomyces sp. NPDC050121 TaxID=3365601 RepID=UPI0037916D8C
MTTTTRVPLAAAGALALLGCTVAPAAALADSPQPPRHIVGELIPGGADGTRHEVFCPDTQHVYGGGFSLSARNGTQLSEDAAADVQENRPNDNATGWIVTVHKITWWQRPRHGQRGPAGGDKKKGGDAGPADLTIHLTCSDDTEMHGM